MFKFRNLATMLFNSTEKFLETPGVMVKENDENLDVITLVYCCMQLSVVIQ